MPASIKMLIVTLIAFVFVLITVKPNITITLPHKTNKPHVYKYKHEQEVLDIYSSNGYKLRCINNVIIATKKGNIAHPINSKHQLINCKHVKI